MLHFLYSIFYFCNFVKMQSPRTLSAALLFSRRSLIIGSYESF
ncbi:hypothetical protein CLOSTASPAR_01354 [[Clostridium] asparagiforme DSM 15981]|uniref:Uncharacterized protein n=1 Tax=[Clostridium] asparagiforme DSM 15981 TaxID=518636 RepID=C0CWI8_9FIRM|nr:hypothetical protein CLOSTASPAR_01354 [[Clostridium] asparagiforme DSM 15981]